MRNQSVIPEALKDQTRQFALAEDEKIARFLEGTDVLILDAQFDADEYANHTGWGHSSVDDAVELALRSKVKKLFLFHHDPSHNDTKIDQMVLHARALVKKAGGSLDVEAAQEGHKCELLAAKH